MCVLQWQANAVPDGPAAPYNKKICEDNISPSRTNNIRYWTIVVGPAPVMRIRKYYQRRVCRHQGLVMLGSEDQDFYSKGENSREKKSTQLCFWIWVASKDRIPAGPLTVTERKATKRESVLQSWTLMESCGASQRACLVLYVRKYYEQRVCLHQGRAMKGQRTSVSSRSVACFI